jgi:hypothetical protein
MIMSVVSNEFADIVVIIQCLIGASKLIDRMEYSKLVCVPQILANLLELR